MCSFLYSCINIPTLVYLSVSTGTNCPHDISPSPEVYTLVRIPRFMSPWHIFTTMWRRSSSVSQVVFLLFLVPPLTSSSRLLWYTSPIQYLEHWSHTRTKLKLTCVHTVDVRHQNFLLFSSYRCPLSTLGTWVLTHPLPLCWVTSWSREHGVVWVTSWSREHGLVCRKNRVSM
jgi:hypothetical protein